MVVLIAGLTIDLVWNNWIKRRLITLYLQCTMVAEVDLVTQRTGSRMDKEFQALLFKAQITFSLSTR